MSHVPPEIGLKSSTDVYSRCASCARGEAITGTEDDATALAVCLRKRVVVELEVFDPCSDFLLPLFSAHQLQHCKFKTR